MDKYVAWKMEILAAEAARDKKKMALIFMDILFVGLCSLERIADALENKRDDSK